MDRTTIFQTAFVDKVRWTGQISLVIAGVAFLLPGLLLYVAYDLTPPIGAVAGATFAVWSFMAVLAVVEPICYYPILGLGGTYLSFLVGNVVNLRLPVAVTAQQVAETKEGTPEAEIASTLGVAGSVIASQVVLTVGAVLLVPVLTSIQQSGGAVQVAVDQVLPALFGALAGVFLLKTPRLGIVPLTAGAAIALINSNIPYAVVVPPLIVLSIVTARFQYKRGWVKGEGII
jgi:hypothetical protein